jgi:hypothetical protein
VHFILFFYTRNAKNVSGIQEKRKDRATLFRRKESLLLRRGYLDGRPPEGVVRKKRRSPEGIRLLFAALELELLVRAAY